VIHKGDAEPELELDAVVRRVIGAAIEVHRILGPGFLETAYEEALSLELRSRGIQFARQVPVCVHYKGHAVAEARLDLLIENKLILELKAVEALAPIHAAQLLAYLKATRLSLGLLMNFNVPLLRLGIQRIINPQRNR
jgi:GxxExxY protein